MNPELTYTLPDYQTQCGCVDILMHTMERYFTAVSTMELTDSLSEALMRTVLKNSLILKADPENYNARAEIMWAGSLSHNGLTGCGTDGGDWACHQLEHELGAMYDVAHGAGLSAVWGTWARYVYQEHPERFARFAKQVLGLPHEDDILSLALKGIETMENYYRSIDMPTSLTELGISPDEDTIQKLAYGCSRKNTRTIGVIKKLNQEDMAEIYRRAR